MTDDVDDRLLSQPGEALWGEHASAANLREVGYGA